MQIISYVAMLQCYRITYRLLLTTTALDQKSNVPYLVGEKQNIQKYDTERISGEGDDYVYVVEPEL